MLAVVTWGSFGKTVAGAAFLLLPAGAAVGIFYHGVYKLLKDGIDKFSIIFASVLGLVGLAFAALAVYGYESLPSSLDPGPSLTRGYASQIVVARQGQTMNQLCAVYRPTWKASDCLKQLQSDNRNLAVKLDKGDRAYIARSFSSDKYEEVGYHEQTVTVGSNGRFRSLASACNRLRPTWKVAACMRRVRSYNSDSRNKQQFVFPKNI